MVDFSQGIAFALISLAMVLTPGPNMIYLISRSVSQGKSAGLISLAGVATGFVFYMLCASLGVTALLMAVPMPTILYALPVRCIYFGWRGTRLGLMPVLYLA